MQLSPRTFPARVAELGFTTRLPVDWISHELPTEDVDFSNPTQFLALAIVTAPHSAMVFAFAGRPAYDDGTIHDWAMYHLSHQQLQLRTIGGVQIAGLPAVCGEATQPSDLGTMLIRFAFLEDGGRLLNLTLTAPEVLADTLREAWFEMLRTFQLETPRGSRFKLEAQHEVLPAAPVVVPPVMPAAASNAESPAERKAKAQPAAVSAVEPGNTESVAPPSAPAGTSGIAKRTFADFALQTDASSFDPEFPINANLRDRGAGLVPRVAAVHADARRVTVAAGAILTFFDVPYGWHVIDDGRRTLVFEPSGKVQISMNLLPREGCSDLEILDGIEAQMRSDYPNPEFARLQRGRIHALAARNIADGTQPLEQYHLLHPFRDESMVLRARVTTTPEMATDAGTLIELILKSCSFTPPGSTAPVDANSERATGRATDSTPGDAPTTEAKAKNKTERRSSSPTSDATSGRPVWWREALELEARDELAAAEEHIQRNCPHLGFAYATAEMYRLRMLRRKAGGDSSSALDAFKKASHFIQLYAGMATSGGEGEALSLERDEFRAQLVADYGGDPEAQT